MTHEESIQNRIRIRLEQKGATVYKTHGSMLSKGDPDLLVSYPFEGLGVFVAIEVKVPGEEPKPLQEAKLRRWRRSYAIAFASDSPDHAEQTIESALDDWARGALERNIMDLIGGGNGI